MKTKRREQLLTSAIDALLDAIDDAADGQEAWREHGPYRQIVNKAIELRDIAVQELSSLKTSYTPKRANRVEAALASLGRTAHRIADERNEFKAQRDALLLELKAMLKQHGGPVSAYEAVDRAERTKKAK